MSIDQIAALGPLPFAGAAVWLFARLVAAVVRLSDEARGYLSDLRAGIRKAQQHMELEQEWWGQMSENLVRLRPRTSRDPEA